MIQIGTQLNDCIAKSGVFWSCNNLLSVIVSNVQNVTDIQKGMVHYILIMKPTRCTNISNLFLD